ncbi:MAG: glycoside hydrolase family 24 [Candidatus Dactylopiibacterium carminicum]|uniref:Lysozyme n=1 Tax=Candidatus Dactylopiibacterium carminicum TaxID=857335 RepID=A0A272EN57_9RHOO|nr:glycoside hydrolase family 24 [Candidatus Dactylopiibacterium carminicum]KAF7597974.1 glycoside hydrolase family 24 [Candidatus Dactylopiibacterium carminicum]PAS91547.1 MAG: glycoside hydrolase family 24 [Candidatus Dactylopiibacterium carminicum]PAS93220.1 MAG: glycoside hydrolase family 24 [Candidatus Dactylopiibacterium carminicum]PAS96159.1 MAG: hypothetical protein BSR46_15890 [Candidatus Dactylopiibacterium carminicum]
MMQRRSIATLGMSAMAALVWVAFEGWEPVAKPPIPGDVPTHGFGATTHADGSPVKLGEAITPVQAVRRLVQSSDEYGRALQRCLGDGVELHQHEWDAFVLLAKNVGAGAVCRSSVVPKLQARQYGAACSTILDFAGITRVVDGKRVRLSCEARANGCYGVWRARQAEYSLCSAGEYPK